jgi:transposase
MLTVRTTKIASGNISVQVVYRHNHKTKIIKHIGTAKSQKEKEGLIQIANQYIGNNENMPPLLPEVFTKQTDDDFLVSLKHLELGNNYHAFAYEVLSYFYVLNGFENVKSNVLRDLAFMRIIEPCSKLRSVALLKEYFDITYPVNTVYEALREIGTLKEETEKAAVTYAKKHLSFDFSLVFYDVTTLYFETFTEDDDVTDEKGDKMIGLRKNGFGKEKKSGQPLIVIGLLVNRDGYPISVEIFSGKTFEGHTMLPAIKQLQERYKIKTLTIVADAAMLSLVNTKAIVDANLCYIVGARMGSMPIKLLKKITKKLNKSENKYIRVRTDWGILVCDYSDKRATKDRSDRKKQLAKAAYQIEYPDKVKRRTRFVIEETKATLKLNQELIDQDILREGIKGYYTNLKKVPSRLIAARYHDLWHVEKSFRIAKSDLQARPIFHHKRESIEAHIGIVFVSLCLAKSIELQTGYSIKKVRDSIWRILDVELIDMLTKKTFIKRMERKGQEIAEFLEKQMNVDKYMVPSKRVLKK